jgi:thiol-disulfide isomerase/thioredoxin
MSSLSRTLLRLLVVAAVMGGLVAITPAAAQDDPTAQVESLALRAYLQNLRVHSYTFWIGGDLGDQTDRPAQIPVGERLDDWQLTGIAGDADVMLSDLARPVLLNFWASWCPPCRIEFPHLEGVALAPQDHAFDVVFVNVFDEAPNALDYLAGYAPELATVVDKSDRLARRLLINSIPTSLLLDADGAILAAHVGILTPTVTDFLDAVAAHPGVGVFVAADHANVTPTAELLPVDAASATPITPGERVLGTLTNDDFQHAYRFEGHAGQTATINLAADSSSLDPYVVLMNAEGERLGENDDSEFGSDAALEVTLPADGTYLVVATRFLEAEGFSFGDYSLTVNLSAGQQQQTDDRILTYGSRAQGRVSGNDPRAFYSFVGHAGDVVTLRLTHAPGNVALTIEVKDPSQQRIAVSEESANGETALVDLELPADGNYLVIVSRPRTRDRENLDYTLTLDAAGGAIPAPPTQDDEPPEQENEPPAQDGEQPELAPLAYGETVSGTLDDANFEDRWTFEGHAGDLITLRMERVIDEPGGLDGYMTLLDPEGNTLVEQDDFHDSVMPAIERYELPVDGTYTVVTTRFGFRTGFSTGDYTLTLLQAVDVAEETTPSHVRWAHPANLPANLSRLSYNAPAIGTLSADQYEAWYTFAGHEGDVITIRMAAEAGDLDPFLILTDGDGFELALNDDLADQPDLAAIEDFTLPATGAYLIRATRYGFEYGPSEGDYTLVIETDAAPTDLTPEAVALAYGEPVTSALSFDRMADRYTFTGRAGNVITVGVERADGDLDPALALYGPDGDEIAANRVWLAPGEARIARVTLPQDGDYTLDVQLEDLNTSGEYRLLLLAEAPESGGDSTFVPAEGLDVELVLLWTSEADLDLAVSLPPDATEGTVTDRANDFCAGPALVPTERRIWDAGTAAPGLYRISVNYRFDCAGTGAPVTFLLAVVRHGTTVEMIGGTLAREGDTYTTILDFAQ